MKSLRTVFFWLHLIAGCIGGVIILIMSATGVLLTYERQIIAWADRGPFRSTPPAAQQTLSIEALVLEVAEQTKLSTRAVLTLRADPAEPVEIVNGPEGSLYVDRYSGAILGQSTGAARRWFQRIVAWHRWLGVEGTGPGRTAARAVTGACNMAFLFLILSGAYLWFPKAWSRQHLRAVTWFRGGLSGKARDFNWHNVFGVWAVLPLFLVVLTALPFSYPWANDLIYKITGTEPPPRPQAAPAARLGGGDGKIESAGLDALWARAISQTSGWRSISAPIGGSSRGPLVFTIDGADGGQPQKRATLALNRDTLAVERWETFDTLNTGRRLRSWSRFTHTGEAFGLPGQTIAGLASLAGVMLVWTGISLALRRFAAWRKRRTGQSGGAEVAAGTARTAA